VQYSVGWTPPGDAGDLIEKIPANVWQPASDADGEIRDGAWVVELTGPLDLTAGRPGCGSSHKERPHPGAQHTIPDVDGDRFARSPTTPPLDTAPTSNDATAATPAAKTGSASPRTYTGPTNLPLHGFTQNPISYARVTPALELPPGCNCSLCTIEAPAVGNPRDSATWSSPSPPSPRGDRQVGCATPATGVLASALTALAARDSS
jgi:hypothetical protein